MRNKLKLTILLFCTSQAWAHDDLDLGIASVRLQQDCTVRLEIQNFGFALPENFYRAVKPAYVTIAKGERQETLGSLRALDKKRQLAKPGGRLTLESKLQYQNIPAPLQVQMQYAFEFGDYGAGNNKWTEAIDCVPGQGQVAGAPIEYTQPDVAIKDAYINPETCQVTLELYNKTGVPLSESAWDVREGVVIMRLNLQSRERAPDIALADIDPEHNFGKSTQTLTWREDIPFDGATGMRLALWRVLGDLDFSNNTVELAIPNACSDKVSKP